MAHAAFLHIILPRGTESNILLLPDETGWTLPTLQPPEEANTPYRLFAFGMKLQSVHGCSAFALYCPYFEQANDEHGHRFVFVAENRAPSFQLASGARWLSADDLNDLPLSHEHLRPILAAYFREQVTGEFPSQRPPWAFRGWQDKAVAWIEQQVVENHGQLESPVELVRKWPITCVMKAVTTSGSVYFKAVPPTFRREVSVTRFLAEHFPNNIPSIAAYHETERWLLLRDFGKELLGNSKEIADWERAVRDFAALQVSMMGHIQALLERDALDYRLDGLSDKFDVVLADESLLQPDQYITAEEIQRIRIYAPRIKEMIRELAAYNIPPTIVHSDFHVWNIAVQNGQMIFFDWTDASVGHPFFDMMPFFEGATQQVFADNPQTAAHIRELYLQGLTTAAPIETLRKALPLGEALGLVHQAVNYHHLLSDVEPSERWSLSFIGDLLKKLLTYLEAAG